MAVTPAATDDRKRVLFAALFAVLVAVLFAMLFAVLLMRVDSGPSGNENDDENGVLCSSVVLETRAQGMEITALLGKGTCVSTTSAIEQSSPEGAPLTHVGVQETSDGGDWSKEAASGAVPARLTVRTVVVVMVTKLTSTLASSAVAMSAVALSVGTGGRAVGFGASDAVNEASEPSCPAGVADLRSDPRPVSGDAARSGSVAEPGLVSDAIQPSERLLLESHGAGATVEPVAAALGRPSMLFGVWSGVSGMMMVVLAPPSPTTTTVRLPAYGPSVPLTAKGIIIVVLGTFSPNMFTVRFRCVSMPSCACRGRRTGQRFGASGTGWKHRPPTASARDRSRSRPRDDMISAAGAGKVSRTAGGSTRGRRGPARRDGNLSSSVGGTHKSKRQTPLGPTRGWASSRTASIVVRGELKPYQ